MKLNLLPRWWFIVVPACATIAFLWTLPSRLQAMEAQVQQIQEYIVQEEKTQEIIRKAPPGWKYDERFGKFIPDPNDPRLTDDGE